MSITLLAVKILPLALHIGKISKIQIVPIRKFEDRIISCVLKCTAFIITIKTTLVYRPQWGFRLLVLHPAWSNVMNARK